jgi:hypothetical protein
MKITEETIKKISEYYDGTCPFSTISSECAPRDLNMCNKCSMSEDFRNNDLEFEWYKEKIKNEIEIEKKAMKAFEEVNKGFYFEDKNNEGEYIDKDTRRVYSGYLEAFLSQQSKIDKLIADQKKEPEFSKEDIYKVARAIVDECIELDNYDNYYCSFCLEDTYSFNKENIKHDTDCPVLVAKDLLTGSEKKE